MFKNMFKCEDININVIGLTEELKNIYINSFLEQNKGKNIIYVKNTLYEANKAYSSLKNYNCETMIFPIEDINLSKMEAISPQLKSRRLETINGLSQKKADNIVVTNLKGYLKKVATFEKIENQTINLSVGESNFNELIERLIKMGYNREPSVNQTGDFSVKGFIIDVFSVDCEDPFRIEFFGDEIVSIRKFDLDSQISIEAVDKISIFPFEENVDNINISKLLKNSVVFFDDFDMLKKVYEERLSLESSDYDLELMDTYLSEDKIINFSSFKDSMLEKEVGYSSENLDFLTNKFETNVELIKKEFDKGKTILICHSKEKNINHILEELSNKLDNLLLTNEEKVDPNYINVIEKKIHEGFVYENILIVSLNDLLGVKGVSKSYSSKYRIGKRIKSHSDLEVGDYVVHEFYGIGIYKGLKTINKQQMLKDYVQIEYKNKDKVYIPVEKIDYITKYASKDLKGIKLNKIGSTEWLKTKLRARENAKKLAYDLLELYAERENKIGFAFPSDDDLQIEFEREFAYSPTADQLKAVEEIKKDMESKVPMDRLLCGDVGFGKTEVAFRAAFKAINAGKQVMIMCPTTILSRQHFANAKNRFSQHPINIAILNRFTTPKETEYILKRFYEGKIDLLIGTHRILSEDVKAKDLGLLVIDEEQRFGVNHKEKLKDLKKNIDVLSLSATPIPRTVQMTMSGIRGLSLIETPPSNRYPVQTYVSAESSELIKTAIYNEKSRGGQAFLLCNNISKLLELKSKISKLVPGIKIAIVHGKMSKNEIEDTMYEFTSGNFDLLICTTIIETGIDIPNVNTLIILEADKFGLSQLYQLRGRVGRSDKFAFCYLMYKQNKVLSELAIKRLKIIKDFTALGSGMDIAIRDLSLRGAGDILGSEQSGFVATVGIEMFLKMLADEVSKLKGEKVEDKEVDLPPIIDVATHIKDSIASSENQKIEIHRRINEIYDLKSLQKVKNELQDIYGEIDEDLVIYMHEELLEKKAIDLGISTIFRRRNEIEIVLEKDLHTIINMENLFYDLSVENKFIKFENRGSQILIKINKNTINRHYVYELLNMFDFIEKNKLV